MCPQFRLDHDRKSFKAPDMRILLGILLRIYRFALIVAERYTLIVIWIFALIFLASALWYKVDNVHARQFAIVSGTITLLGVLLTLLTVRGVFDRFRHIRPLLRRMSLTVRRARKASDEFICLIGYYPAFGSSSITASQEVEDFCRALTERRNQIPILVLTYDEDGRNSYLIANCRDFGGDFQEATRKDDALLNDLRTAQRAQQGVQVIEVPFQSFQLPSYQLLFTASTGYFFTVLEPPVVKFGSGKVMLVGQPDDPRNGQESWQGRMREQIQRFLRRFVWRFGPALLGLAVEDPDHVDSFRTAVDRYLQGSDSGTFDELLQQMRNELR